MLFKGLKQCCAIRMPDPPGGKVMIELADIVVALQVDSKRDSGQDTNSLTCGGATVLPSRVGEYRPVLICEETASGMANSNIDKAERSASPELFPSEL